MANEKDTDLATFPGSGITAHCLIDDLFCVRVKLAMSQLHAPANCAYVVRMPVHFEQTICNAKAAGYWPDKTEVIYTTDTTDNWSAVCVMPDCETEECEVRFD